ncbi:hypothetical protein [Planococcus salinus]|uniref:Group-specific protein n=1 Tax=Planococcus salinus TaxID=1848460 RepID=A0A3M8P6Q4_9BACL|nr:hypothetical protein [Planococcus salinus]RNF39376.1 hypothetical protein EEX84_09835 [Planococcus salinus]
MVSWLVAIGVSFLLFLVLGKITGSEEHGYKTNDDERKKHMKQQAIIRSWIILLVFFAVNFINDFFNLSDMRLTNSPLLYPELLYLLIAGISYCIFYVIYRKRLGG